MRLLIAVLIMLVTPFYVFAQEPLVVTAKKTLEWDRAGQIFTARGDAVAQQGTASLRAPVLTARYNNSAGSNNVSRIEAIGGVVFRDQGSVLTGANGFYDIESGYAELRGSLVKLVNGSDVVTAKNRMTYNALSRELKAHGDATAMRGDDELRGDVLIARFRDQASGDMELRQIEAKGHVRITTPTEVITGETGLYDVDTNIATISGNVVITQGQNRLTGSRGQVNLNTNLSTLFAGDGTGPSNNRVKGVFFPK